MAPYSFLTPQSESDSYISQLRALESHTPVLVLLSMHA